MILTLVVVVFVTFARMVVVTIVGLAKDFRLFPRVTLTGNGSEE